MTWPKIINYILLFALLVSSSCSSFKSVFNKNQAYEFPYDLADSEVHILEPHLAEVSGLCFDKVAQNLIAIEDETGVIYSIDEENGSTIKRDSVYKAGDYEGITHTSRYYFMLKSTGTIYQIDKKNLDATPTKIKSYLNKDFDAEGLTYLKKKKALLISAKQHPEGQDQNQRSIFLYNLKKSKLDPEPFIVIDRHDIVDVIKRKYTADYAAKNFNKIIDKDRVDLHLGPSGIAFQSKTKNLYILSSRSKLLLVYNTKSKKLLDVIKLDKTILPQPEGICFDKQNNLYIASEAKNGQPRLIAVPLKNNTN